ncbi:MAG: hypothetical protein EBQ96_07365 [Proteobacteria bacterium]|nr:hypothetical protein [Pseudomonadota bacterium]
MVSGVGSTPSFFGADFSAQRQALFQKADANGSGGLSLEEFKSIGPKGANAPQGAPSATDVFSKFDANSDGELTQSELDSGAKTAFESRLSQGGLVSGGNLVQLNSAGGSKSDFVQTLIDSLDGDGDGSLNLDEFKAGKPTGGPSAEDVFSQLDSDGDGSVTASELESGLPQGGPPGGFPPGGPPPGGKPGGAGGGGDISAIFGADDTSQSSASNTETSSTDEEEYDDLDTNKDGVVSASEKAADSLAVINSLLTKTLGTLINAQENSLLAA